MENDIHEKRCSFPITETLYPSVIAAFSLSHGAPRIPWSLIQIWSGEDFHTLMQIMPWHHLGHSTQASQYPPIKKHVKVEHFLQINSSTKWYKTFPIHYQKCIVLQFDDLSIIAIIKKLKTYSNILPPPKTTKRGRGESRRKNGRK